MPFVGTSGSDVIAGYAGNDIIDDGGGGPDELIGGVGDDVYFVRSVGDSVVEHADEGTDTVRTTLAAYTLLNNVENITFIGTGNFRGIGNALDNVIISGAGNDTLAGGTGADTLIGGDGNDSIEGGTGAANTLIGGRGNDIYYVAAVGDTITENANEGFDRVYTSVASLTLAANLENLGYTGSGNFIGVGNALDNVLFGGAGNDSLDGGAGNDVMVGYDGNDALTCGGGLNELIGGFGDDSYYVTSAGDTVVEYAGQGTDTIRTTLTTYRLGAAVENLAFTGVGNFTGYGNALDNIINGGFGDDILYGFGGTNRLLGGFGDDSYYVESSADVVVEDGNAGIDTIYVSASSYGQPPKCRISDLHWQRRFHGFWFERPKRSR
jgi:Ca2+-binding RTX toxin-like protein